jgi:hypothetical protein
VESRRARPDVVLAIGLGGALGAPARYELAQAIHVAKDTFPWATFVTNLAGAFVLGAFLALVVELLAQILDPGFAEDAPDEPADRDHHGGGEDAAGGERHRHKAALRAGVIDARHRSHPSTNAERTRQTSIAFAVGAMTTVCPVVPT